MKNWILFFALFLVYSAQSQIIVNKVNVLENPPEYISVYPFAGKLFDNKINVGVNYGQPLINIRNEVLESKDGTYIDFNSEIDMLNYFFKNNYELFDTYFPSNSDGAMVIFLLKRKK